MPSHEPGIDLVDLRLQLRIFLGLGREQLPSQGGQALIGLDAREQRSEVSPPLGGGQAELARIATDRVAQLRAIADQPVSYADQHQGRLLLSRLHRHEAHCRPAHRLAKRFRVRRIVLAALEVRLDQLRRDQLHRMPERLQQSRTMVAGTAGFDRDHRRRKLLEECEHLFASQLLAQNRLLGGVHSVKLENVFRRIHTNSANLVHGWPPLSEIYSDLILARLMPSGAVHTNRSRLCGFRHRCWRLSGISTANALSGTLAGVTGAVLEDVWLAIDREDYGAFVRMGLVKRARLAPYELAGAADPVVIVEGSLDDPALLDLRMLVHRQGGARLPLQQAGHLALLLVLVKHLDRDALELCRLPFDGARLHINRAAIVGSIFGMAFSAGAGMGFSQRFVTRERYDLTDPGEHFTPNGQRGDIRGFPHHPFYSGNPWFLPVVGGYYRVRDNLDRLLA